MALKGRMNDMETVSGQQEKFTKVENAKRSAMAGGGVATEIAIATALTAALVAWQPALAPASPAIVGGLAALMAAGVKSYKNWQKNKGLGK